MSHDDVCQAKRDWRASREDRTDAFASEVVTKLVHACSESEEEARAYLRENRDNLSPLRFNEDFGNVGFYLAVARFFPREERLQDIVFMGAKSPIYAALQDARRNFVDNMNVMLFFKYGHLGDWAISISPYDRRGEGTRVHRTFMVKSDDEGTEPFLETLHIHPAKQVFESLAATYHTGD